jgi:uncharacterized protein YhfF
MTTASYEKIFELYYTLYRAESTVPTSSDDEFIIGKRFANEAIARWANYDGVYWKELFTTLVTSGEGTTATTGTSEYDCPDDFREAGGYVSIKDTAGSTVRRYPIIEPQEAQFKGEGANYAYFTGNPSDGYVMHLNPAADTSIDGMTIDYVYYKKPTQFGTSSKSVTECPNAEFIAHRMLAMRYRASRNPFYQDALRDSEDALKIMKMDNDSGSWANPWKLADNSGAQFGSSRGGSIF